MKWDKATLGLFCVAQHLLWGSPVGGEVIGWGEDVAGEATGTPSFSESNGVVIVGDKPFGSGLVKFGGNALTNALTVSGGQYYSLALRSDGTVVGWGDNQHGRAVGMETPKPYRTNGSVILGNGALSDVVSISAGGSSSLALKRDGTVAAWGTMSVPAGLSNVIAIASGLGYNLALKRDGTIVWWGTNVRGEGPPPVGLSNVVSIALGGNHGLALKKDGSVVEWGGASLMPDHVDHVKAIAAGLDGFSGGHSLALKEDGTVIGWGANGYGQATIPQGLSNVVAIAAGSTHSLALKSDGTLVAWGDNRFHQAEIPDGLSNVVTITAGNGFNLAITTNSAVAERFRH